MGLANSSRFEPLTSVASACGPAWRLKVVNASELLDALIQLPGARSVPVEGDGVLQSSFVGGVEIARAANVDERR